MKMLARYQCENGGRNGSPIGKMLYASLTVQLAE